MRSYLNKHRDGIILFLCTVGILLPMVMMIHPFEVPDENAHFASLNFLRNEGRMPTAADKDNLSLEEFKTEEILGIVEHKNKYSYHPEFRMEYIDGYIGKFEEDIKLFNTPENRTVYRSHQSALYPPLYYLLTLPIFRLADSADILTRLFVSRISSVILTGLIVVIAYLLGIVVFERKKYAAAVAAMTLLFPMTGYIGAGVNSDNLHNLLFSFAVLLAAMLIKNGWNFRQSAVIGSVIGLDMLTKPQAYILIPVFAAAVIARLRWEWRQWLAHIPIIIFFCIAVAGWQEIPRFIYGNSFIPQESVYTGWGHFRDYVNGYVRTHMTEMPVWYWGVYKWFGVLLPKVWWWTAIRLAGLAGIGIVLHIVRETRKKSISFTTKFVLFSFLANIVYILAIFWFDWQFYQQFGRSLGLQARYYMPLLGTQMVLLLLGLTSLGWNEKAKENIRRGSVLFFVGLQLASVYTQVKSYYDISSFTILTSQISQYKPFFAKAGWWYLWTAMYVGSVTGVLYHALHKRSIK